MPVEADPYQLRYTATQFSNGANALRQKAKRLADIHDGLVQGSNGWKGQATQGFTTTMEKLQNELQQKAGILEDAAKILQQFAYQMDNVNQIRNQAKSLEHTLWNLTGDSEAVFHERQSMSFQINQLLQEADWQARAADAQATSAFHALAIPPMPDLNGSNQSPSLFDEIGNTFKKAFDFVGGVTYALADDFSMGLLDQVLDGDADQRSEAYQEGKVIGDEISVGLGVLAAIDGLMEAAGGAAAGIVFSETGVGAVAGGAIAVEGIVQAAAGGLEAIHAYTKLEVDKSTLAQTQEESSVHPSANDSEPTEVEYGDHFTTDGRKKVLKPNIKYTTPEGYTYTTDSQGRIATVEGKLELGSAKRNQYAQRNVGGEDRLPSDDGGHLIATIFKGSGEIDNLVPMDANLNRSEYKALENTWKKALAENKEVVVSIEPIYSGKSLRPSQFEISYKIDGERYEVNLENYEGGTSDGN